MTKQECEKIILGLAQTMREVLKQYNPDGKYFSLSINDTLSFNNSHWIGGEDEHKPVDITVFDDGGLRTTNNINGESIVTYYDNADEYFK